MANDISTIQSLKAVDAWIDVINANINGGVRTAFKASRLRFAGSNTQIDRAPTVSSLPLQLPEPGLITANTVIDWTQGAITSSTETTHLAIQGEGFFLLASPDVIESNAASATFGATRSSSTAQFLLTRDGEFHTDQNGFLRTSFGYYLVSARLTTITAGYNVIAYDTTGRFGAGTTIRAVYNDVDTPNPAIGMAARLTDFLIHKPNTPADPFPNSLINMDLGKQNLKYSSFGSTVYDFGYQVQTNVDNTPPYVGMQLQLTTGADATILTKSLEASNSSMTQSVPELSLAQKLFSALTKVLQIGQTNTDSVLNLVR